jgi:hypothetical protein
MKDSKNCDCGICSKCNELDRSDTVVDESGFMIVQILDPDKEKMLKGLAEILPPMDVKEIILASLQDLKISSGIIKVAAKHKPNNPKLWSKCIAEAKRKFDVFPSAYSNGFASRLYKKKGGTWKTVKPKRGGK